jgi:CheY-like chemotaxis protein
VNRILIAEDETINRMYIISLLKKWKLEGVEVGNGEAALAALQSEKFDLLLLDMGLPDMDGLELAQKLRSEGNFIPIVAVTGRDYPEDQEAIFRAGIQQIVAKPIQEYVLYDEIKRILGL